MNDTRRYVRLVLTGTALVFATAAGGTIGYLTAGGPAPLAVTGKRLPLRPHRAALSGTTVSRAQPAVMPATEATAVLTLEPTLLPTLEPTAEPTPTLAPLEAQTPIATPVPEPAQAAYIAYEVERGDILSRIAARFGVSVNAIIELNPQIDPESLVVGDTLLIPR